MFKKINLFLTLLISLFINCFCYGFKPLKLDDCKHTSSKEYYNIETFNDKGIQDGKEICCKNCTIQFMKNNLTEYVGTPYLIKTCGFYLNHDGEEKINIKKQLNGYICDDDDCKCYEHVIFIDNEPYRIFNLHWGPNYLPRVICLNYGHEKKAFTVEKYNFD